MASKTNNGGCKYQWRASPDLAQAIEARAGSWGVPSNDAARMLAIMGLHELPLTLMPPVRELACALDGTGTRHPFADAAAAAAAVIAEHERFGGLLPINEQRQLVGSLLGAYRRRQNERT